MRPTPAPRSTPRRHRTVLRDGATVALLLALVAPVALHAVAPSDPAAASREAVERARDLAASEREADALLLVERALTWTPDDPQALQLGADLERRFGRLDAARELYERLLDHPGHETAARFWLATLDRWAGEPEAAVAGYDRVLAADPDHRDALEGRALALLALGRPAAAEADLVRLLESGAPPGEAGRLLARALTEQGRAGEADAVLERHLSGPDLAAHRAEAAWQAGDLEEARRHLRSLAWERPSAEVHRRLGETERRLGDDAAALAAWRRAAELAPDDPGAHYWIGVLALRTGSWDESVAAFDRLLAAEPGNAGAALGKARVLHFRGEREAARELVAGVLEDEPENAEARELAGAILAARGELRAARREYRRALEAAPDYRDAEIALERIARREAWGGGGDSRRDRVVEGLDDAGLVVDGTPIRPTFLEYVSEGVGLFGRALPWRGGGAEVTVEQRREAVRNLDGGFFIYDLDLLEAGVDVTHHLGPDWRLEAGAGAVRYEPREAGSIAESTEAAAAATLVRERRGTRWSVGLETAPFIHRGFAGDTQFRIFSEDRLHLAWQRRAGARLTWKASASASRFGAGSDDRVGGGVGLDWRRGEWLLAADLRHEPIPERFLDPAGALRFVDFDGLWWRASGPLGGGLRLDGGGRAGRYGATPRSEVVDGVLVAGPAERNDRLLLHAELAWTPPPLPWLTLGVDWLSDDFAFDTAPYNTVDLELRTAFVELAGRHGRWGGRLRAATGRAEDDRDPSYDVTDLEARLEIDLGPLAGRPGAPTRLVLEGALRDATLEGAGRRFEEESPRWRLWLEVPY